MEPHAFDIWYEEARRVGSAEDLAEFIKALTAVPHSEDSRIHAATAALLGALAAFDGMLPDGLSSEQTGQIVSQFIRHTFRMEGPLQIVQWGGLLNSGNESAFRTIPARAWNEIKAAAHESLEMDNEAGLVDTLSLSEQEREELRSSRLTAPQREHLSNLAAGIAPWGFTVES